MHHPQRTHRSRARIRVLLAGAAAALLAACGVGDDDGAASLPSAAQMASTCSDLAGKTFAGATVTSTRRYEADATIGSAPFCQVLATRAPYLDIEVDVPDNWSGRLWQQGGGGFDGRIPSAVTLSAAGALTDVSIAVKARGAVYAASNGGNRAAVAAEAGPAVWVNGTTAGAQSAADYAYVALGTTRSFAKAVTQAFFKRDAARTYFNGCSNGGRNAYIAIERWPGEYDGVVSGCEGMDMSAQTMAWMNMARLVGTPAMPSQAQWTAVYNAAVASCDAGDGLADGTIANYAGCGFDVGTRQCGQPGASTDPAICLSAAQLVTVRSLIANLTSASGQTIYSGYGWANWSAPGYGGLGSGFMALATNDASWLASAAKRASFDVGTWYGPTVAGLQGAGADHDKIAIASFIASGKKLINWHDGADGLLSLNDHARNVAAMHAIARTMRLADPADDSRFFVVPGTGHSGGAALTAVDWSDAIIKWVENGIAPTQLAYTQTLPAGTAKRMPVCEYPKYARYAGGDVNAATSYACTAP